MLEEEVIRLKKSFSSTTCTCDTVIAENRRLKELLTNSGIAFDIQGLDHNIRAYTNSSLWSQLHGRCIQLYRRHQLGKLRTNSEHTISGV